MNEILITSSVLILALLLLRFLFRNLIPRRVQYALWALVALRLLVPVELPALPLSVLNAGQQTQEAVSITMEQPVYLMPIQQTPAAEVPSAQTARPGEVVETGDSFGYPVLSQDGQTVTKYAKKATVSQVLGWVWKGGMAVTALFFLSSNLIFWRKLRRERVPYPAEHCTRPVYLCKHLSTPCLFGFFRPAIYLTPEAVATTERLRHVLLHEETHARHLDPLWSFLRCVCLTVYWFHPLVWVAAIVSRTDCELACDEGALRNLRDDERLDYGRTLLALVPVKRTPANPLLTATTMAAGKKQLKDRITRIARNPKPIVAAVLAAALLAGLAGACTFAAPQTTPDAAQALTGEELRYFNEDFFNGDYMNIRNQFLSSHYENPKDIDLFSLFYNGDGSDCTQSPEGIDPQELSAALGLDSADCPTFMLTTAQMDEILSRYTGLTLEETNQVNLSHFQYDQTYDLYYNTHGDTNYRSWVNISAGTRDGDQISLYYQDDFNGDGWKCLTLQDMGDGSYQFRSNVPCEKPDIATAYPDWEPELTIPVDDLTPYEAPAVTVERHTNDCAQRFGGFMVGDYTVRLYLSTDGNYYAAVVYDEAVGADGAMSTWDVGCFLTLPAVEENYTVSFFSDLFGHDGIVIRYNGQITESYGTMFYDYYYLTDDGTPVLLARTYGVDSQVIDLNGDGTNELAGEWQFFFQRDGQVYEADLKELLEENWPALTFWDYAELDPYAKALRVTGLMTADEWSNGSGEANFVRTLYFDGKAVRVYRDERETVDHLLEGVTAPEEVVQKAKDWGQKRYDALLAQDAYLIGEGFDDWRITQIETCSPYRYGWQWDGPEVEIYSLGFEAHSSQPESVVIAGGMYILQDGWIGGFYVEYPYLVCIVEDDGTRTFLESRIPGDCSEGSQAFLDGLNQTLQNAGYTVDG